MALKVCVLGSGSTGNCIFVQSEQTTVLVDLGLSAARVEKCLAALGGLPQDLIGGGDVKGGGGEAPDL